MVTYLMRTQDPDFFPVTCAPGIMDKPLNMNETPSETTPTGVA
jgi:hypothetical protein